MLQVDVLGEEWLEDPDLVLCQAQPRQQLQLAKTLQALDPVARQVKYLEVVQLGNLEHATDLVVLCRKLEKEDQHCGLEEAFFSFSTFLVH